MLILNNAVPIAGVRNLAFPSGYDRRRRNDSTDAYTSDAPAAR